MTYFKYLIIVFCLLLISLKGICASKNYPEYFLMSVCQIATSSSKSSLFIHRNPLHSIFNIWAIDIDFANLLRLINDDKTSKKTFFY